MTKKYFCCLVILCFFLIPVDLDQLSTNSRDITLPLSSNHPTIFINGNTALDNYCSGNGTDGSELHPHVIKDYKIEGSSFNCIEIRNTDRYLILDNLTLLNGDMRGIILYNCSNISIKNCNITEMYEGIYFENCSKTFIQDCDILDIQGTCITSWFSSNNLIKDNRISSLAALIILWASNFTLIENNTFNISDIVGLYAYLSSNNTVQDNRFVSCQTGCILSQSSNNNTLYNNTFLDNGYGLSISDGSQINLIYQNYFLSNFGHTSIEFLPNQFDNGSIGNYWDDYTGKDLDDNGIGDTPYVINAQNIDDFPIWEDGPNFFGEIVLISDAESVDSDGDYILTWIIEGQALNYSIYYSDEPITGYSEELTVLAIGITINQYSIDNQPSGNHYYIVVGYNETDSAVSNSISVHVELSNGFNPIPYIIVIIIAALGFVLFSIYMTRKKNGKKLNEQKRILDERELQIQHLTEEKKSLTKGDIAVFKEKHFCLVHKGPIEGLTFICPTCFTFYCIKCYQALSNIDNTCWSCGNPLDAAKPVSAENKEDEEIEQITTIDNNKPLKIEPKSPKKGL
jgi:parallel beta-helix repeat protein